MRHPDEGQIRTRAGATATPGTSPRLTTAGWSSRATTSTGEGAGAPLQREGADLTAQLVGTGLGLLLDGPPVAIALPLGLWLLVGALGPPAWLQQWLAPFAATAPLLAGAPSVVDVAVWAVVLVLWGGVLNGMGAARLARRRPAAR